MSFRKDIAEKKASFILFIPLLLLYAVSYFQRTALPGTIYDTFTSLGMSASQIGTLGASFVYTYAIFQLVSGVSVDRFCGTRVVLGGGILFILGCLIFPLSRNFWLLCFARMITGIGASTMFLSLVRETDRLFGRKNYAVMFGIAYFCGYAGGLMGTLPFEYMCSKFNWHNVLLAVALLSVVFYILLAFGSRFVKLPPVTSSRFALSSFKYIFTNPLSWKIIFCSNVNFCVYFTIQTIFGKKFLADFAGFSSSAAAAVIFSLTLVCMFTILSASILTRMSGNRRKPLAISACGLCMISCFFMTAAIFFRFPSWCFAVIFCLFAAAAGMPPIFSMMMQEYNSKDIMAQAVSVSNMFGYLTVAVSSQCIGLLLDSFDITVIGGIEHYSQNAYLTIFIIASLLSIISFTVSATLPETKGHYLKMKVL